MADRIRKTIEVDITGNAQPGLNDVDKTLKDVDKSTKAATEATKGLKQQYREVIKELQSGKLTGKEFDEATRRAGALKDEIGDINTRVNNLASDTQKLDAFLDIGSGIAGGFAAAQGAAALFGGENEKLQETLVKVQGSLAVLNGIQAVANTLNKDSAASTLLAAKAKGIYTAAIGTSTGALKAFRIALISTGIGAIVVGLGLLITNFETVSKWVSDITDKFGGWRNVLAMVAPPIWAIVKALEALGIIDDEETEKVKNNAEERRKAREKAIEDLDKEKEKVGDRYDFEIRLAKAAGKDVTDLEKQKRKAAIDTLKAVNDQLREVILNGTATREEIKKWNETNAELKKLYEDDAVANAENERKKTEAIQKAIEDRKKAKEDADKKEEARLKRVLDFETNLIRIIEDLEDKTDEDRLKRQKDRRQKELDELKTTAEEKIRLQALLDEEFRIKEEELQAKREEERRLFIENQNQWEIEQTRLKFDEERRLREEELQAIEAFEAAKNQIRLGALNIAQSIFAKNKELSISLLLLEKGLAVSQVVTSAAKSIATQTAANASATGLQIAQMSAVTPFPANLAKAAAIKVANAKSLAANIALTKKSAAASITSILAQTIGSLSSSIGGGGGAGGGGAAAGGGSGGGGQAQFNIVGQSTTNQLAETISRQTGEPVKAFVVASEVTTAQSLDRNRIQNSTFL